MRGRCASFESLFRLDFPSAVQIQLHIQHGQTRRFLRQFPLVWERLSDFLPRRRFLIPQVFQLIPRHFDALRYPGKSVVQTDKASFRVVSKLHSITQSSVQRQNRAALEIVKIRGQREATVRADTRRLRSGRLLYGVQQSGSGVLLSSEALPSNLMSLTLGEKCGIL